MCCAATATVAVSSIEASYSQEQRVWFGNDGPPSKMRVLFGMISWCNQTAGFTAQVRFHWRKPSVLSSCRQRHQAVEVHMGECQRRAGERQCLMSTR